MATESAAAHDDRRVILGRLQAAAGHAHAKDGLGSEFLLRDDLLDLAGGLFGEHDRHGKLLVLAGGGTSRIPISRNCSPPPPPRKVRWSPGLPGRP
jgi:hypothetical protein